MRGGHPVIDMVQDKLWDAFQTDPELRQVFRPAPRLRRLLREVDRRDRILHVGVGDGSFERLALAIGLNVSSLDPSDRTIRELRDSCGMTDQAQVGSVAAIPFPADTFDVVVMSEVLEHLDDDTLTGGLEQIVRVLKSGGHLLGTVPADENLRAGQTVCPDCGKRFHRWGHRQSFTAATLTERLGRHLQVLEIRRAWFPDYGHLNWKGRLLALVKSSLIRLGVKGEGETLYFKARRR